MAKPPTPTYGDDVPSGMVERLRSICAELPDADEEAAWVGVRWRVRRKTFAHVLTVTEDDGTSTDIQSIYGVFDRFEITETNSDGTFADSGLPLERSDLVTQTITNEVFVVRDNDGNFIEKRNVRTISENTVSQ